MTFKSRVLVAGVTLALVPLVMLAIGVRRETRARLEAQYEGQSRALVLRTSATLARENASIGTRLARVGSAIADDNRFRLGLQGDSAQRAYVLDYAARAMRLSGLDVLEIHDSTGRILSSGQFRNDFDRVDSLTARGLAAVEGPALLRAHTVDGGLVALARVDSARVGGRMLTLIGGRAIDAGFVAALATDSAISVRLELPEGWIATPGQDTTPRVTMDALTLPFVDADGQVREAGFVTAASFAPLQAVVRGLDRWFLAAVAVTALGALALAGWLSARVTRPLTELAEKTAQLDLDRLDVDFGTERQDEIGVLSRFLDAMTARLKGGAARLREAERRLAVGELARQVNHDVKNGLIPVRNVVRHLAEVAQADPGRLPAVFADRKSTLESGLGYLESLAASYARLTPQFERSACDANAVVREVTAGVARPDRVRLETTLADGLPPVRGDAVILRRIVENLVDNAVESLGKEAGTVRVTTAAINGGRAAVALTVADTGPGMTRAQLDKAFEDFFTTKPDGTGLGLSIVRRLVLDLDGSLKVETAPGKGTSFRVDLPTG